MQPTFRRQLTSLHSLRVDEAYARLRFDTRLWSASLCSARKRHPNVFGFY